VARPRRKGKPSNAAGLTAAAYATTAPLAHDRQAQHDDLLRNAVVAPAIVEDPYDGERIVVTRSLRDDPLGRLHARKQIDSAQEKGGRGYQDDFENAGRGPRAIDTTKEAVDGGRIPELITEEQRSAVRRLAKAHRALGYDGSAIVQAILIHGQTCAQIASARGLEGERWERYFGMRLRECLDTLAVEYGFATGDRR
jgi:hypothetical protein